MLPSQENAGQRYQTEHSSEDEHIAKPSSPTFSCARRKRRKDTDSRFGSDPSGLLKPASFAETQAAKQSLSSKVIVSICQKQSFVLFHLHRFSKYVSKPLSVCTI